MTTSGGLDGVARVIVGVDTHLDEHVAVAIDHHGARLGEYRLAPTAKGYEGLESWAIGDRARFSISGLSESPVWTGKQRRGEPCRPAISRSC